MGYYVNPATETKESFLENEGREVQLSECKLTDSELPVVLVDNGFFTAAGIAYSEAELQAFTSPGDRRPKRFFMVPKVKLEQFM
jgi:hypothetical protein